MLTGTKRSLLAETLIMSGLVMLMVALPLSRFLMSVSQFVLIAGWLLAPGLAQRLRAAARYTPVLLLAGLYLLHVAGMLYSTDIAYGLKDLRIKLPLLIFPLVLATIPPVSARRGRILMWTFTAALFISSLVSYAVLLGYTSVVVDNIRDISPLISHIRLSLLVCLGIYFLAYAATFTRHLAARVGLMAAIGWFLCFLVTLESLTGLLILVVTSVLMIVYLAYRKTGVIWGSLVLLLMVFASGSLAKFVQKKYEASFHVSESQYAVVADTTRYGNPYTHDFSRRDVENGHLVFININWDEMGKAWHERSRMPFDGKDLRDQELRYTLLRFLAFKGWNKDYDAVTRLSSDELKMVERGHTKPGQSGVSNLQSRIEEVMWEVHNYRLYGTHGGHSVMQRWVFWKTSLAIIRTHTFFGVGTGDVMQAYEQQYSTWPTTLEKKWQLRAHNQYLAMAVAFGIPGLLFFLVTLIAPMFLLKKQHSFLYVTFLMTALLSMVAEDTLETQAGVTFYAFFNAFFLFVFRNGDDTESMR